MQPDVELVRSIRIPTDDEFELMARELSRLLKKLRRRQLAPYNPRLTARLLQRGALLIFVDEG